MGSGCIVGSRAIAKTNKYFSKNYFLFFGQEFRDGWAQNAFISIYRNYRKLCKNTQGDVPTRPPITACPLRHLCEEVTSVPGHVATQVARVTTGASRQCHLFGYISTNSIQIISIV